MDPIQIVWWLRRLVTLDTRVFDEARTNPAATLPGVIVAAAAILASGIGGWLWWSLQGFGHGRDILLHSTLLGSILATLLWGLVWVSVVYLMLTQVLRERAYLEQLLRVMGLAAMPLALTLLMFVPFLSFAIGVASLALTFGLTTIAVQSVTTARPGQVLAANLAGFFAWCALLTLLASSGACNFAPHAPGIFLFETVARTAKDLFAIVKADFVSC